MSIFFCVFLFTQPFPKNNYQDEILLTHMYNFHQLADFFFIDIKLLLLLLLEKFSSYVVFSQLMVLWWLQHSHKFLKVRCLVSIMSGASECWVLWYLAVVTELLCRVLIWINISFERYFCADGQLILSLFGSRWWRRWPPSNVLLAI
jgi:hypothetical protein